eukprot:TRINITY_DN109758_c0_g1_i1.p2 TRINITY_DN109758_c0_g1~~TRINITY_DN109758_c0_g1_i1.p2  ORF type:complete len:100 (+),score=11.89 TRINITY_DN109758_c0_g1_i1:200-499(+)
MDKVTKRLAEKQLWDQVVFNEEVWAPSSEIKEGLQLSIRIMDYHKFSNSKTFWRTTLKDENYKDFVPVVVHVNYHPEKWERMRAIWQYYVDGDKDKIKK